MTSHFVFSFFTIRFSIGKFQFPSSRNWNSKEIIHDCKHCIETSACFRCGNIFHAVKSKSVPVVFSSWDQPVPSYMDTGSCSRYNRWPRQGAGSGYKLSLDHRPKPLTTTLCCFVQLGLERREHVFMSSILWNVKQLHMNVGNYRQQMHRQTYYRIFYSDRHTLEICFFMNQERLQNLSAT